MTTCLDTTTCPNDKMYNVICNFSIGYNEYLCNPQTTCMRADGRYDCCSKNIVDCVIDASSLQMPTIQPTISSSDISCNQQCQPEYRIDKCHWYESMQVNTNCNDENDNYCCSHKRADCCRTNTTDVYIVIGCITGIMILYAFYKYVIAYSAKVMPSPPTTTLPPEKYQIAVAI
jgi:hypothetical protein